MSRMAGKQLEGIIQVLNRMQLHRGLACLGEAAMGIKVILMDNDVQYPFSGCRRNLLSQSSDSIQ